MSVIPKEQLGGFQRWQINSFDQKPTTTILPPPTQAIEEVHISNDPVVMTEEPVNTISLPSAEEIELIYEEARNAGYETGFKEGKTAAEKEGQATVQKTVASITPLIKNMETALGELEHSVAQQVLDLALEVARQLSSGAIKAQPDYLLPIIRESIASLPLNHPHIILHLNPADAANLRLVMGEQISQNNLQIHESNDVTQGGCRVTAGSGEMDATIETRWHRVLKAIGVEPQAWLSQK